jgi:hypothetical protein
MYTDYMKPGSNFGTRKLLSLFWGVGSGRGKMSECLDLKLTIQTKKLSLVQVSLYVT